MNVVDCTLGREVLFEDITLTSVTSLVIFVVFAEVFWETEVNDVLVENVVTWSEDDSFDDGSVEVSVDVTAFDVLTSDGTF